MLQKGSMIYAFFAIVLVLGIFVWSKNPHTIQARLGGFDLSLEVASTQQERSRGLSEKPMLTQNEGMLFVFPIDGYYSFWMKEMSFPIDILWLDAQYAIVDVAQAVQPDSYPQLFTSRVPARYVLELPAGFFTEHLLRMGNILEILK